MGTRSGSERIKGHRGVAGGFIFCEMGNGEWERSRSVGV
jgi:hypothetical protein